eukprot:3986012-Alexandrium_andersonii.AAC.1
MALSQPLAETFSRQQQMRSLQPPLPSPLLSFAMFSCPLDRVRSLRVVRGIPSINRSVWCLLVPT